MGCDFCSKIFVHASTKLHGFLFCGVAFLLLICWTKFVHSNVLAITLAFLAFKKLGLKNALPVYECKMLPITPNSSFTHLDISTFGSLNMSGNKSATVRPDHLSSSYSFSSTTMSCNGLKLSLESSYLSCGWIVCRSGRKSSSSLLSINPSSRKGATVSAGNVESIFLSDALSPKIFLSLAGLATGSSIFCFHNSGSVGVAMNLAQGFLKIFPPRLVISINPFVCLVS